MSFISGSLLTNVHSREPRFDFLRRRSPHSLTIILRCDQRFDQIKILSDFITMRENVTLSTLSKPWKNRIFLVHRVSSRRQLVALVQCIHNQLGKSICFQWLETKPKKTYKTTRTDVHKFAYSGQSKALISLSKDLNNRKKTFDSANTKSKLVDILAEPVDIPYHRKMLKGEDESCSYLSLASYFAYEFLDDSHILHKFECSPILLPNDFQDIVVVAKERCLDKMLSPIRSRTPPLHFDTIIQSVIKRCYQVGLGHLIPKLWKELSCQDIFGKPDPIKQLEAKFDYYIATDNQAEALTLAVNWPVDASRFTGDSERSRRVEQTLLPLAQQGKEVRAFELALSNPTFRDRFSSVRLWDYDEIEIRRSNFGYKFNPLLMIAQLMIITCHSRGIDRAIEIAREIPIPQARSYAFNHLILRLALPNDYWRIWKYYIKEYTIPKKAMDLKEIHEAMSSVAMSLMAGLMGISRPPPPEVGPFTQDLAKAIMLFRTYPVVESENFTENCTIQRSLYLFAALWTNGDKSTSREFLEIILKKDRFFSTLSNDLKKFDISLESVIAHFGIKPEEE